ncbi:hypothetical protein DPMN_129561 [Dreissena polymorpha]|uniref:Uncharacterized protein n=1 Tax=Dreissena polymorpha TaxID=45954 RepID=A0A9D4H5Z3_DREPO|nr:hypothetical protein DPMN_129561 [Dreissena polymorpha]
MSLYPMGIHSHRDLSFLYHTGSKSALSDQRVTIFRLPVFLQQAKQLSLLQEATVGISNKWILVNGQGALKFTNAEVVRAHTVHSNATSPSQRQNATTSPDLTYPNNQQMESLQCPSSRSSKSNAPFRLPTPIILHKLTPLLIRE